ncbi:hypothetical protein ACJZ2D_016103 [Fusarium nematophilum]
MPLLGPPGSVVLAVIFILIGVAACAIAARIYLRLMIQKRRLIMSDFLMIAAWLCACTAASFDIVLVVKGVLKPENDWFLTNLNVDAQTYELLLKIMWGGMIPFYTTFYLCKASLLSIYLQLFPCFVKKRRILLSVMQPEHLCDPAMIATAGVIAWVLHISGSIMKLWGALDAYIGLVIACLPSLRPYFRSNPGTSSYGQSKKPSGSAPLRLGGESGFREINDGLHTRGVVGGQETSGSPDSPDLAEDDAWNDDGKSNRSDIELLHITARPPTKALTPV